MNISPFHVMAAIFVGHFVFFEMLGITNYCKCDKLSEDIYFYSSIL